MREIRENPIEWFIKSFSVLSAMIFVTSGALNALLFAILWRVNYFLIASPSDVIMSAFMFGTITMAAGLIAFLFTRLFDRWLNPVLDRMNEALARKIGEVYVPPRQGSLYTVVRYVWMGIVPAFFLSILGLAGGGLPYWYRSGLVVSPQVELAGMACGGGKVAWLGSGAAIVECPTRTVVIRDSIQAIATNPLDRSVLEAASSKSGR